MKRAKEKASAPHSPQDAGDLMTKLTFGFWVSLVSRTYDRPLWVPALHRAFPHYHGRRDALYAELREVLWMRNRVMHYEAVLRRDLEAITTRSTVCSTTFARPRSGLRQIDRVPSMLRLR